MSAQPIAAVFALCCLVASQVVFGQLSAANGPRQKDESEIRLIVEEEVAGWNAGDAKAYARHFADEGTFTNIYGMVFEGREQFERRHAETFAGFFKGSTRPVAITALR